jgi:hypothetical protein
MELKVRNTALWAPLALASSSDPIRFKRGRIPASQTFLDTTMKNQDQDQDQVSVEVRNAALFVVAALSPSFLVSVIAILLYLTTSYPSLRQVVDSYLSKYLLKFNQTEAEK